MLNTKPFSVKRFNIFFKLNKTKGKKSDDVKKSKNYLE